MAEGKRPGCEIVRTKDTSRFQLRVWPEDPGPAPGANGVYKSTEAVVAGCKCTASYLSVSSDTNIMVILDVRHDNVRVGTAHMVLLDKTGSEAPSIGKDALHMEGFCTLFVDWYELHAHCVVDNYFDVMCTLRVNWKPPASPVDLGRDLAIMSDKQDLTDVSFDVGGESFSAHRLVLATRSPVFKAELYGPMAESNMTSITIQDMDASTFRSMLYYMYHCSLPVAGEKEVCSTMAQYQHLLVAADRYRLEGLKKICEEKLCGNGIMIDNVVSMLELAEDHVCPKLKTACFDFLADGENFKIVATSAEYLRLMQNFPAMLVEVRDRFKVLHEKPGMVEPAAYKKTRLS